MIFIYYNNGLLSGATTMQALALHAERKLTIGAIFRDTGNIVGRK